MLRRVRGDDPAAGSAYTYATLGEMVGWIIGWDLIIEYAVGNIAVAISWGSHLNAFTFGRVACVHPRC